MAPVDFLKSPPGAFKVLELIFGLLCWALTAQFAIFFPAQQFVMVVSVTSWILTLVLFIIYLLGCHSKLTSVPWPALEFVFNAFWSIAYLVAACVSAAFTYGYDQLAAATFFAFFTTAIYVIHSFVAYLRWKGSFPWQSGPRSVTVNT